MVLSSVTIASLLLSLSVNLSGNILVYLNIIGVFMCAGRRAYVRSCVRACVCVCMYVPGCVYARLNMFIFTCLFAWVRMYLCFVYMCVNVPMHVYLYVYVSVLRTY